MIYTIYYTTNIIFFFTKNFILIIFKFDLIYLIEIDKFFNKIFFTFTNIIILYMYMILRLWVV